LNLKKIALQEETALAMVDDNLNWPTKKWVKMKA
jgi:hypothetical protein